jgi:hypothetical protein
VLFSSTRREATRRIAPPAARAAAKPAIDPVEAPVNGSVSAVVGPTCAATGAVAWIPSTLLSGTESNGKVVAVVDGVVGGESVTTRVVVVVANVVVVVANVVVVVA